MLRIFFKPLKWFVNQNVAIKVIVLIIIGILGYAPILVAEYLYNIQITSLLGQLLREGFGLLLSASALTLFCAAVAVSWKERKECWNNWSYWYQSICLIAAACGLGFVVLAHVSMSIAETFAGITLPLEVLWYSCIPSALFFIIGALTFVIKVSKKMWKNISQYVADAWRNA